MIRGTSRETCMLYHQGKMGDESLYLIVKVILHSCQSPNNLKLIVVNEYGWVIQFLSHDYITIFGSQQMGDRSVMKFMSS